MSQNCCFGKLIDGGSNKFVEGGVGFYSSSNFDFIQISSLIKTSFNITLSFCLVLTNDCIYPSDIVCFVKPVNLHINLVRKTGPSIVNLRVSSLTPATLCKVNIFDSDENKLILKFLNMKIQVSLYHNNSFSKLVFQCYSSLVFQG